MNHAAVRRRLSDFIDGSLALDTRRRVEDHLARCPACRDERRALEQTVRVLRGLDAVDPPSDLARRVMARLEAGEGEPPRLARFRAALTGSWAAPVATAAAAFSLLLLVQSVEVEVHWPGIASATPPPTQVAEKTPARSTTAARTRVPPAPALRSVAAVAPAERHEGGAIDSLRTRCLRQPGSQACAAWHSWLLGLAVDDPPAFVMEANQVPVSARPRWLGDLSRFAVHSGSAAQVARRLRAAGDPRAQQLAPHFEQIAVKATR